MANAKDFVGGWKTTVDGEHLPMGADEAKSLWDACEAANAKRRNLMPDSMAALATLQDALTRLRDEGWRDGIYCPKDGTTFAAIEFGSTGIFTGAYFGEWPDGYALVSDGVSHPSGLLWKHLDRLSTEEGHIIKDAGDKARATLKELGHE